MSGNSSSGHHYAWWLIMCLCGVDYFSTLGYQPSIAFDGAGLLAPLATLVLVLVTLFGALPIYWHVAGETPDGVGSVGMIERISSGWKSKLVVLVLVGFAATDFVITKTLSAADASAHLLSNPIFLGWAPSWLQGQVLITMALLLLLSGLFIRGYREVVGVATVLVIVYIAMTAIVVFAGLAYLWEHPELLEGWLQRISAGQYGLEHSPLSGRGIWTALAISLLIFPKLALGMSGFETGVLHIHLVRGSESDPEDAAGRIRRTRCLLITAAIIMSTLLVGSSLVTGTGTLIPVEEFRHGPEKGKAVDRALAFLAHGESPFPICGLFGPVFGTVYDISTILILWFAGASAMAGLLNMVPRYLPRYGMAPEWAAAYKPLVIAFTCINLVVTWSFNADVSSQGGAYATGVLMLMTSAAFGSLADLSRKSRSRGRFAGIRRFVGLTAFGIITLVFVYTTGANIAERPDGILIASIFIGCVLCISLTSRICRSDELRFHEFRFRGEADRMLWTDLCADFGFRVLVPHRPGGRAVAEKEIEVRRKHRIPANVPLLFLEVYTGDTSEFHNSPVISARQESGRFILQAHEVVSVPHTIAQIAIELGKQGPPLDIVFGRSVGNSLWLAVEYLLFGQGDVPNNVFDVLERAIPDSEKRPVVLQG